MTSLPGSYALILCAFVHGSVRIGRIGYLTVIPGFYVYVGSAFGSGGVCARIAHHARITRRPHWHIDYLRRSTTLEESWYTNDPCSREHQWTDVFRHSPGASEPLDGFGSSDCRCRCHLFRFAGKPSLRSFRRRLALAAPEHGAIEVMRCDNRQEPMGIRPIVSGK